MCWFIFWLHKIVQKCATTVWQSWKNMQAPQVVLGEHFVWLGKTLDKKLHNLSEITLFSWPIIVTKNLLILKKSIMLFLIFYFLFFFLSRIFNSFIHMPWGTFLTPNLLLRNAEEFFPQNFLQSVSTVFRMVFEWKSNFQTILL